MTTLLAVAVVVAGLAGVLGLVDARVSAVAALLAQVGLLVVGIDAAGGWGSARAGLGTWLGFGTAALRVDGISGVFLALVAVLGIAVTLGFLEAPPSRLVATLHAALLFVLAIVVTVDQAFVFLLAWEALSVLIYLIASADRAQAGSLVAGYLTGGLNKLSGAALLAAFGLLYGATTSFSFDVWHAQSGGLSSHTRNVAFVLLVCGFAAKIGVPPLQAALPTSYGAAPPAASPSLSIALVAGFYGLWRLVFETLTPSVLWWGEVLLIVGVFTALLGILYAIAQADMRRFLGCSSIEHTGIALLGLGAALVGKAAHEPGLVAAGILAGTLHVIAHALAKTLALLSAERIGRAAGTNDLGPLGGIGRCLPRSAVGLGLATLTLAAIPPFGGFVSEWFTLEALLQGFRVDDTLAQLLMALSAAGLALTAGLGLLAFTKLFGTVVLGQPRSALPALFEPGPGIGVLTLSACVLVLGALAPWEIRLLGSALQSTLGFDPATTAISHPLVLGPVYRDFSVLAPTWLSIVLPTYAVLVALIVRIRGRRPARRAAPWVCGTSVAMPAVQYTPAGYSNPIRVVLRGLYGFRRRVVPAPGTTAGGRPLLVLETSMVALIEDRVYRPLTAAALSVTARARRLQSGRLGTYLAYLLIVLLVVLALIPTLKS